MALPSYENLVAHWKLNDNASNSTLKDTSINRVDGTWVDGTTPANTSVDSVSGKIGNALTCSPRRGTCGNNTALQLSTGTITAWVKTSDAGTYKGIVAKQEAYSMFCHSGKLILYSWGGGYGVQTSNITINDNNWHFVACSFSGNGPNNAILYVDDNAPVTVSNTATSLSANPVNIGDANSVGVQILSGIVDDVRIYNKVLTSTEISDLYNSGSGTDSEGVISIDFGMQSRWLGGLPCPVQYNNTRYNLGSQSRWLGGLPSIVQYQSYTVVVTSADNTVFFGINF